MTGFGGKGTLSTLGEMQFNVGINGLFLSGIYNIVSPSPLTSVIKRKALINKEKFLRSLHLTATI